MQYNVREYFYKMSAVDLGRLNDFIREIGIGVAEKEGGKTYAVDNVYQISASLL